MIRYLFTLLFLAFHVDAGSGTGKVTFLLTNSANWVVFNIENYSNHPCETPNTSLGKLKFELTDTHGQAMYSQLLAAESSGKVITVLGSDVCIEQSRENVNWISVGDPTR